MRPMRAMNIWLIALASVVGALPVSMTQAQETESVRRAVVVGFDNDYPPIEFTDGEGTAQGFAVDMMRAVAEEMGLDLEFRPGKWSDVQDWLVRGEIDVVAGMLRSEGREENFLFSRRVKSVRHSVFIRTGSAPVTELADLAGRSIIVTEEDIGHEFLQSRGFGANLALVASVPESLRLLAAGEFDCAVAPLLIGRELARVEGLDNIHAAGPALFIADLCLATRHDRGELVSVLDQGLRRVIDSGRRDELYAKWFGAVDPAVSTLGQVLRYGLLVIGLLLALLAAAMLWSWSLRRRVAERTTMLSRELAERERAEAALRTSEQRYRSLVQTTTSIIWTTNAAGEFIEPQESWEQYTGQPWEEHRGNGWARMIHPDDLPRVSENWGRVLSTEDHHGIEGRLWHRASGEYRRFEANGVPIRGPDGEIEEWIGTIFDVEDKLRVQAEFKVVESRFQQMAETAPDVFWFADLDPLRVRYVNPAFERIWGESAEAIYAHSYLWQQRVHPEDRLAVAEAFTRFVQSDGSVQYAAEYRVVGKDGKERWISDRGVSMQVDRGSVRSIAGIASDITERKENERRQRFMMQELDHRVKNNLAAVLSIADTTMAGSRSLEEFSEAFRGRILALARSHVALAEAHWTGVDLKRLVEQTISPYQDPAGNVVEVDGDPLDLPPGAAAAVCMTLNELCTNAVKHGALSTPSGHVRVEWRKEEKDSEPLSNGIQNMVHVVLKWSELRGPPTQAPSKKGMGLALMEGLIGHELAGKIDFQFGEEGLSCIIRFPLDRSPTHPVLD